MFDWTDLLIGGLLEPVHRGEPVSYRPPAWGERNRAGAIEVPQGRELVIIEGAGAARRELTDMVDAVVWVQSDMAESSGFAARLAVRTLLWPPAGPGRQAPTSRTRWCAFICTSRSNSRVGRRPRYGNGRVRPVPQVRGRSQDSALPRVWCQGSAPSSLAPSSAHPGQSSQVPPNQPNRRAGRSPHTSPGPPPLWSSP
jgi:hypothetical protein